MIAASTSQADGADRPALAGRLFGTRAGRSSSLAAGPASSETVYVQGHTAEINTGAAVIFDASVGLLQHASPIYIVGFPVAAGQDRSLAAEQRRRIAQLERTLGKKTYELEISGKLLRDWE